MPGSARTGLLQSPHGTVAAVLCLVPVPAHALLEKPGEQFELVDWVCFLSNICEKLHRRQDATAQPARPYFHWCW